MVYVMSSIASCPKFITQTNVLLFSSVWDNEGDKVKRIEMIADYRDGGLKIEFNKTLKITWILIKYINIFDNCHSKWKCFFDFHLSKFTGKLGFTGNLSRKDAKSLAVKENFLQELIELLTDLNYRDSFASLAEFSAEGIWNNSLRLESQARLSFIRNGLMQEYRILMMF